MIQSSFPAVSRVYFFCLKPGCEVPAVWRIDYEDGSFWTICEAHYHIAIRSFPTLEARSRALLPDEAPGAGIVCFHKEGRGGLVIGGQAKMKTTIPSAGGAG
jgi:hypothetical protein